MASSEHMANFGNLARMATPVSALRALTYCLKREFDAWAMQSKFCVTQWKSLDDPVENGRDPRVECVSVFPCNKSAENTRSPANKLASHFKCCSG
jgi:hypothetical protein